MRFLLEVDREATAQANNRLNYSRMSTEERYELVKKDLENSSNSRNIDSKAFAEFISEDKDTYYKEHPLYEISQKLPVKPGDETLNVILVLGRDKSKYQEYLSNLTWLYDTRLYDDEDKYVAYKLKCLVYLLSYGIECVWDRRSESDMDKPILRDIVKEKNSSTGKWEYKGNKMKDIGGFQKIIQQYLGDVKPKADNNNNTLYAILKSIYDNTPDIDDQKELLKFIYNILNSETINSKNTFYTALIGTTKKLFNVDGTDDINLTNKLYNDIVKLLNMELDKKLNKNNFISYLVEQLIKILTPYANYSK